jgi:hypothetical protein
MVKAHFEDKAVGIVDAIHGMLDEVPFHVFAMKEENYVMMLISTHGTNEQSGKKNIGIFVGAIGPASSGRIISRKIGRILPSFVTV